MLRRRFMVCHPTTSIQQDTRAASRSVYVCPTVTTSCAGIFSLSSPLLASSASTKCIKAHGIIKRSSVKPVSKWTWDPFCTQFTDLVHSPSLGLPKARKMEPSMQVFAKLDIDENVLRTPPKGVTPDEHCNIEGVMKGMGYRTMMDDGTGPTKVLENNQNMVMKLARALEQRSPTAAEPVPGEKIDEGKIDECSHQFLQLCGFGQKPFEIDAQRPRFRIFNKWCSAAADQYVVLTPNDDLVLIFEDKSLSGRARIKEQGHLGRVTGELLQSLSLNRANGVFRNVFGIRYINYHVARFRVEANRALLDTLVETRNLPGKKLQLLCSVKDPFRDRGLSLIDKKERSKALRMMADIREFILKQ